jgi:hypothetical protein
LSGFDCFPFRPDGTFFLFFAADFPHKLHFSLSRCFSRSRWGMSLFNSSIALSLPSSISLAYSRLLV